MCSLFQRPNILFLRGIFPVDLEGDDRMFEAKFTQSIALQYDILSPTNTSKTSHYDSIPKTFTTLESWVKYTNLKCWNCGRTFKTRPWFIPTDVYENDGQLTFNVEGNTCRKECSQAYICSHYTGQQRDDRIKYLKMLNMEFTGENSMMIISSIPRTEMKEYCGNSGLTEEEYDAKIDKLVEEYKLYRNK